MTVIELGLVRDDGDRPDPERPLRRVDVRRWLAAAIGVLCLLTVTGSAVPRPHGLPTLWSVPFNESSDSFQLSDGVFYLMTTFGGTAVTAYDARTGAVRWKNTDVLDAASLHTIDHGVVLLPADYASVQQNAPDGTVSSEEFYRATAALDTATGRTRWRTSGDVSFATDDLAILTEHHLDRNGFRTLRAVRLRDGSPAWSRTADGYRGWVVTDGPPYERIVAVTRQGVVEVIDTADGRVLTSKKVPWQESEATGEYTSVGLDGRFLYVTYSTRRETTVVGYEADTMRELWRRDIGSPSGGVFNCGSLVCLNTETETAAYDRDTGRPRWRIAGAANGFPILKGKLLVQSDNSGGRHLLVDQETGRTVADVGGMSPVWNSGRTNSPYLLKRSTEMPGYTSVSYFQEKTGKLYMRGKLPPVRDFGCQSDATLLACVSDNQRVLITDVG